MEDSTADLPPNPNSFPTTTPPPAGKRIFISHGSRDFEIAMKLAIALESVGIECWIAPRDIPAGHDFNDSIMKGLEQCPLVLLVYSRHAVQSDPVFREIERAKSKNKLIVPVRLENTALTPRLEFILSISQWIDAFPPPVDRHLPTIIDRLAQSLDIHVATLATPSPGPTYIGPYRVLEQIGEGGMGAVYKAEQRHPIKRLVAIKSIKQGLDTKEVLARFEAERQALARMDHPNIAKVFEAGADGTGHPYFAMEYVPGEPIVQFCDAKKLKLKDRLELFVQVCDAISHAHAKGIVHRDIKPSNLLAYLADGKPTVKAIDFGIAKALTGEKLSDLTYNTDKGQVIGTWEYMSPEQAGAERDVDTRTDVYSLGVVLYELLSGIKPFDLLKSAEDEARRIIREKEPPRPSTKLSGIGEPGTSLALARQSKIETLSRDLRQELEWIPLMALRKERERRYQTPQQLADDIRNYQRGDPLIAGPESRAYRLKKAIRQNRGVVAAVVSIVLVLVIGILATGYETARAKSAETIAVLAQAQAVKQQKIAVKNAEDARAAETEATKQSREAQLNLAHGMVAEGETLEGDKQYSVARDRIAAAYLLYEHLGNSTIDAEQALGHLNQLAPLPLMSFNLDTNLSNCVAISPDGRTALSGSTDKTLRLWDLRSGKQIRILAGHNDAITCVAISPDGRAALSGSADKALKLWDLNTGNEIRTLTGHTDALTCVAISGDGHTALSGSADKTLKLWDLRNGKEIRTLAEHTNSVRTVAISPDGHTAISGSDDKTLKVWDLDTGKAIRTLTGHTRGVFCVAISPDGHSAISGSGDKTLKLWDLASGKEISTLIGHTNFVTCVAMSPDGHTALSGSWDGTLKLWDLSSGEEIRTLTGHANGVVCLAISLDGMTALSSSLDHSSKLWDLSTGTEIGTFTGHTGTVECIAISPDGRSAISGSGDKTLKLWDLSSGKEIRTFSGHTDGVGCVAISPDGRDVISGSWDGTLKLWDMSSGKQIRSLTGHTSLVECVAISPDGETVISGSKDKTLKLWNRNSGKPIRTLTGHAQGVYCVAISPDGHNAISGSGDKTLKLWDLKSGQEIRTFTGHTNGVSCVAINPDGRTALSGSWDGTLKLWDLNSGKEIRTLSGHFGAVDCLAISPDGNTAISGSEDKTLKLWDLRSGKEIATLTGHRGTVLSVGIGRDGHSVLSGSYDTTLKQWDFSRAKKYIDFKPRIEAAQKAIAINPNDPVALNTFGQWYAFRGFNDWAVEFFEKARAGGADVSPLMLGRCYWEMNKLPQAQEEFERALTAATSEQDQFYLRLCLDAIKSPPATQPAAD